MYAIRSYYELDYLQTKNLGFDQEQLVVVPVRDMDGAAVLARLRDALAGHDEIAVVFSYAIATISRTI